MPEFSGNGHPVAGLGMQNTGRAGVPAAHATLATERAHPAQQPPDTRLTDPSRPQGEGYHKTTANNKHKVLAIVNATLEMFLKLLFLF